MLKPYRQIEFDDGVVYEYKTIYFYVMYGIFGMIGLSFLDSLSFLVIPGMVLMVLYFLVISTQYLGVNTKVKRAAKAGAVEMSGSKWSFSKPLRVKIRK